MLGIGVVIYCNSDLIIYKCVLPYKIWLVFSIWLSFFQRNQTPLHVAAANGHKDVMEVLIRHGARMDVVDMVIFIID